MFFRSKPFLQISPKSYRHNAVSNHFSSRFSTSRTNGPRSLSRVKVGTHSAFGEGSHTAAYTAKQGPSLPRPQRGFVLPVKFFYSATLLYTYISRFSVNLHYQQQFYLRPSFIAFFTFRTNGPRSLSRAKAGTRSALLKESHTAAYTPKHGAFRMGALLLPSERSTRFGNPAWPGFKTANFAAFGSWSGVLSKNAESLRNSDALMRVAVPRRRGPAGLRDPVAIVSMIKNMINPWAGSFLIFCWANANSIKKVVLQPF